MRPLYLILLFIVSSFATVSGQDIDSESSNPFDELLTPESIHTWDDIDFMYISWEEVKETFVPEEVKETTLLFETFTLEQYTDSIESQLHHFLQSVDRDTTIILSDRDMSGFMYQQSKETKTFRKKYGNRMKASNTDFIQHYSNIDEYRFVLRKIFVVYDIDEHGEIFAGEEFYFYDRKEKKAYPRMKADYAWVSLNI